MLVYGLMKFVEKAPFHYDKFINLMTFGHYQATQEALIDEVNSGDQVLDVGCGPGRLSIECVEKGAVVTAVDASIQMLDILRSRQQKLTDPSKIEIHNCGSGSMDRALQGKKFDKIVASLMLGELSDEVRFKTLEHMKEHLSLTA